MRFASAMRSTSEWAVRLGRPDGGTVVAHAADVCVVGRDDTIIVTGTTARPAC